MALCLSAISAHSQNQNDSDIDRKLHSLINLSRVLPDGKQLLDALNFISMNHNNVDTVEKYSNIEAKVAIRLGETKYLISAYLSLGWCYYYRYNYKVAKDYYMKALEVCDAPGLKSERGKCYHSLANTMAMMKKFVEADEYDRKALKLFYELNDSANISNIYRSLSQTCSDFCLYDMASEHLNNALSIDTKLNNTYNIANDYLNMGYIDLDKYEDYLSDSLLTSSKQFIMKAYHIFKKLGYEIDLLVTCQDLMKSYLIFADKADAKYRQQFVDSSKIFYREGLKLAQKNNFLDNSHYFSITKAQYAIFDKQYDMALNVLKDLETTLGNDTSLQSFTINLYEVYVDLYSATNNYKLAYDYQCKADLVKKNTFNREYALKSTNSDVQKEIEDIRHDQEIKEAQNEIERNEKIHLHNIINISATLLLALLIGTIATLYKIMKNKHRIGKILESRNNRIEMQRDQLAIIHDDIQASIFYAKNIQNSMIPTKDQMTSIWGDHLVIWQPLNIISGDFYWTTQVGNQKLITAVDCTGHGVPGAFMSMLGMSTLSDITASKQFRDGTLTAANILDQMRQKVMDSLHQTEQSSMALDGMDMALCIINENDGKMQYAGAFRPLVIVNKGKELTIKADKMPVSYLSDKQKPFTNNIIDIENGDIIYMFSDGITDQFGFNEKGEEVKFTTKKLTNILNSIHEKPFEEQRRILLDTIGNWCKNKGKISIQTDDELLIGIRLSVKPANNYAN